VKNIDDELLSGEQGVSDEFPRADLDRKLISGHD
jgi:hypothetical protein